MKNIIKSISLLSLVLCVCSNAQAQVPGTPYILPAPTSSPYYKTCKEIKNATGTSTNGTYTIDPDSTGSIAPFNVYCDMAGGGWTLIGIGGSSNGGQVASITNPNTPGYLSRTIVAAIAANSTVLQLREGANASSVTRIQQSSSTLTMAALMNPSTVPGGPGTWHNGASSTFTTIVGGAVCWNVSSGVGYTGWPNMYQSASNATCVHAVNGGVIFDLTNALGWGGTFVK